MDMDEMQSHHNQASGSGGTMSDSTMATTMPAMTMAMTFSSSTTVTLLFAGCTTTTPAAYAGALLLLFALSVFHRFLGAVRAQLERTAWWHGNDDGNNNRAAIRTSAEGEKKVGSATWWRHVRRLSAGVVDKRVLDDVERGASEEEREPLSPRPVESAGMAVAAADGHGDDEKKKVKAAAGFWTPSGPWRVGRDGVRSTLECGRAALGYLLSVDFFLVSPPLL